MLTQNDFGRTHELRTLGGLISPLVGVGKEILHYVTGTNVSEEFAQELRHIITESEGLLKKVLEKTYEEDLVILKKQEFVVFYHLCFVEWQKVLHKLIGLNDSIMTSASQPFAYTQEIAALNEKLKIFLTAKEWNVE